MPGYKKPKMGHKPKMAHGDKPKMAHAKKPQFNAKLKKAAAKGELDNSPKFKAAVEKAMYNKKPFMMKPGSKQVDSPSSFKSNEPAMMFKMGMSGVKIKGQPVSDTKEFSSKGYSAGEFREFSKRSGKPIRMSFQGGYDTDEATNKANIPVGAVVSKITGKSYDDVGGRYGVEGRIERNKRVQGYQDEFKKIGKKKFGLKPSMYGKPKMYGKKK